MSTGGNYLEMFDDLILPIPISSSFLVGYVPGSLTHWTKRGRSYTLKNGYCYHILILWIKGLTMEMFHDNVDVNMKMSPLPNTPANSVVCPSLSSLWVRATRIFLVAYLTSNTFLPSSVREREEMHMYNLALMSYQLDVLWHFECTSKGRCDIDLCLTPRVSWTRWSLWQQAKQTRLFSFLIFIQLIGYT